MLPKDVLRQMLGLSAPWEIQSVDIDHTNMRIELRVGCQPGTVWAEDGKCLPIHGYETRTWRHLFLWQYETTITASVPRVRIPLSKPDAEDGDDDNDGASEGPVGARRRKPFRTELVRVPWAERGSRFTRLFEAFAILIMQKTPSLRQACEILKINWGQAERLQEVAVERGLQRREQETLEINAVGIDEKCFAGPYRFATLLCDLTNKRLLDMVEGRTTEAASELIAATLSDAQRESVQAVTMDMSGAFEAAKKEMLPRAVTIFDRFHVSWLFNKALTEVRQGIQRELKAEGDQPEALKGLRFLILKNAADLSKDEAARLDEGLKKEERLAAAWEAKENFNCIWDCPSRKAARAFFTSWHQGVMELPGLRSIKRAANTVKRHLEGVLNYIDHRLTNAFVEGLNSLGQVVKSSARGFSSFESFRTRMLFRHGKLSMLP
jgi:transposase